jgi:DNA-binding XRE family transcriptional regulator
MSLGDDVITRRHQRECLRRHHSVWPTTEAHETEIHLRRLLDERGQHLAQPAEVWWLDTLEGVIRVENRVRDEVSGKLNVVGGPVKQRRGQHRLTQEQLAQEIGVSKSWVAQVEQREIEVSDVDHLGRLAQVFGALLSEFRRRITAQTNAAGHCSHWQRLTYLPRQVVDATDGHTFDGGVKRVS